MEQVIDFFKYMNLYNESLFNDIKNKSKIYNINYIEIKDLVGCYIFKQNNKIDFKLLLPKINDINDILIYIHEYTHAIFLDDDELFPNIMEAIFINIYVTDINIKKDLLNNTINQIENSNNEDHVIGKKIKLLMIKR